MDEQAATVTTAAEAEAALWAKAHCDGDKAAFDRLQALLEPVARRFARRLIGRASEAEEDILREACLALYLSLPRLDRPERVRPFVFRVVRNLCYDELRRQGRFQAVALDREGGEADCLTLRDTRLAPDETLHWATLISEVQRAIERLPELQRQALILYGEEDLSYAQIAEVMGVDIGTVKSRIYHARQNLSARLTPETREALGLDKKKGR